jgi:hypothetical protein
LFAFICLPFVSVYHYRQESGKAFAISILAGLIFMSHRKNVIEEVFHLLDRRNVEPKEDRNKL